MPVALAPVLATGSHGDDGPAASGTGARTGRRSRSIIVLLRAWSRLYARRERDVGSDALSGGQELALDPAGRGRRDDTRAGSVSDVTGRAVSGPLDGRRLRPMTHDAQFWFAVAAFLPDVEIVLPS